MGLNPHPRLERLRAVAAVEITGGVPDTRPYIHHAAAQIIPMRIGGGTRFKALEAMAWLGRPSSAPGLALKGFRWRMGRNCCWPTPRLASPPRGAAADRRLAGRPDAASPVGRRCPGAFVTAHYGWEQIVPKLEAVYDQAAG